MTEPSMKISMERYRHLKSGRTYWVLVGDVINATNAQDGQNMVYYMGRERDSDKQGSYVREAIEFHEKFKPFPNSD